MQYKITEHEAYAAKIPHHIFNLNIILVHLFIPMIVLEIGSTIEMLLTPIISSLIIAYIYFHGKKIEQTESWFVAAHWKLAWKRSKILLYSYAAAAVIILGYLLIDTISPGGMSMNDFSTTDTQTKIGEIIAVRFAATVVFVAVLITFMQTGISVFDAGKGIIDPSIEKLIPRGENANEEIGEYHEDREEEEEEPKDASNNDKTA
jgi:hypothetical protein